MGALSHLFANNRAWAERIKAEDPDFFKKLSGQQTPPYLWIGCSDSRVPANQIIGLLPGEVFVHRNVANLVVHTDMNCHSVIHFAVDMLRVREIIVCGHYGCGGVNAVLQGGAPGLIGNWLRHVEDVRIKHAERLEPLALLEERARRLCELNVIEQVGHVCDSSIVREAWARGQPLGVHGWIYSISDGLLRDLRVNVSAASEFQSAYDAALSSLE